MKSRNGKIARLPKEIRDELNRRLENGGTGKELVVWLNGLPEVQQVLSQRFGGRAINEQNMSEWKQGGYLEWVWARDDRSRARQMLTEAEQLGRVRGGKELSEHLEIFVAVELAEAVDRLDLIKDRDKRWQKLRGISRELSRLRDGKLRHRSLQLKELKQQGVNQGGSK